MDIVFAFPQTMYDSYTDLRNLVSVSGFESCNVDDISRQNTCYITSPFNGDVDAALSARPKSTRNYKIVIWYLERPANALAFVRDVAHYLDTLADEFWVADIGIFSLIKHLAGTRFVAIGSDERIGSTQSTQKVYDFCHMSYVYGRRDVILRLKCKIGPNGWGELRNNILLRSKFMVNVHQDENQFGEPLRFALAAAYAMPVISETI